MEYYSSRAACPNRAKLAAMSAADAVKWAASAPTHCSEVSREAEVQAFFGLTRAELRELQRQARR